MEGNYPRSKKMEGHSVGGKNSNRVINASDDDDDDDDTVASVNY
jgi:hypothetical protein